MASGSEGRKVGAVDTPWGEASVRLGKQVEQGAIVVADGPVTTFFGKPVNVVFQLFEEEDGPMRDVRIILVPNRKEWGGPGQERGWYYRADLDPSTGLPHPSRVPWISLQSLPEEQAHETVSETVRVRQTVEQFLSEAEDRNPGYFGKICAAMATRLAEHLDFQIENARRTCELATAKKAALLDFARTAGGMDDDAVPAPSP